MEEFKEPEAPTIEKEVQEKKKQVRNYIHLEESEINDLISTYRKLLRLENAQEKDLLVNKITELERELKFRSKLVKKSAE